MKATPVVPGLWLVKLGFVNAYLLDTGDGLVVIDTGVPGSAPALGEALRSIGKAPGDVRSVVVTHCHSDHSGSLAAVKRLTGAAAIMHPIDAALVRVGASIRPYHAAPGLFNGLMARLAAGRAPRVVERAAVEHEVRDGDTLPGGLRVVHVPGHCAGQIALLWPEHGGVLIAADAAAHVFGLGLSILYEDLDEGLRSLRKLSALAFEVACFGHGPPIRAGASLAFATKWARDA